MSALAAGGVNDYRRLQTRRISSLRGQAVDKLKPSDNPDVLQSAETGLYDIIVTLHRGRNETA